MKNITCFAASMFIWLAWVMPASAITFGQPDTTHTNVGTILVGYPGAGFSASCSGTLIHPGVVLTAGHCTDWFEVLLSRGFVELWVSFQQNPYDGLDPDDPAAGGWIEVAEVITHPDYNDFRAQSDTYDVGLVLLAEAVTDLPVATLPESGLLDELRRQGRLRRRSKGAPLTVVGYGGSLAWPPPVIFHESVRQFAHSAYITLLDARLVMSQNHAPGRGHAGTCYGDSGGPTFWTEPDGSEILVAITSSGDVPCVALGMAYRIDTPEVLDFIYEGWSEAK